MRNIPVILAALLLALGMAAAGFLVGRGVIGNRTADRFVSVKGLAEKNVEADMATWDITLAASNDVLTDAMTTMESHQEKVLTFLKEQGFDSKDMTVRYLNVTDNRAQGYNGNNENQPRYTISSTLSLRSAAVRKVQETARKQAALVKSGVLLTGSSGPYYAFTRLNEVKPAMLSEAVANARQAAGEFARESSAALAGIRTAQQGQFSILARDDTASEQESIEKKVRVVSTVEYYLER